MEAPEEKEELTRVTMNMTQEDVDNLEATAKLTSSSRASCIVTALALYRKLLEEQKKKSVVLIEDRRGNLRKLTIH